MLRSKMHPELKDVSGHMKEVGLGVLSQAQQNNFYNFMGCTRLQTSIFAVLQAAHAAELLIKACIAEQHPLLIFSNIPKSGSGNGELLDIQSLMKSGRTIDYVDLPERLWATTGYQIQELEIYKSFGKLRNTIQHFAVPNIDLTQKVGEFVYRVIDPLIWDFWGLYAVEYCDDDELEYNFLPTLVRMKIEFRCPDEWTKYVDEARQEILKEG